ncbi:MAG TPA: hypothetical protein VML55_00900 [Planctomycetaceae bacterium]|nr:hypothetical protein [Planctomycetaceae bacterium]
MRCAFVAIALAAGLVAGDEGPATDRTEDAAKPAAAPPGYFRGVFKHKGLSKSIRIWYERLPAKPARVKDVRVHVEQGCFSYSASGYLKGSRLVLLPISDYLETEDEQRRLVVEWFGEQQLKLLDEQGNLEFDIASLVCHLDADREIQKVDIILADLTTYHAARDHQTPHDP